MKADRSLDFVMRLNTFADECEKGIRDMRSRCAIMRSELVERHGAQIKASAIKQKQAVKMLNDKCAKISSGVSSIMQELTRLDTIISRVDKYYQKKKDKDDDATALPRLHTSDDYMEAFKQVADQFAAISVKYTEKTLPFLVNDIHYMLSKKRKDDYAELLALRHFARKLNEEVKSNIQAIMAEETEAIEKKYALERNSINQQHDAEMRSFEELYSRNMDMAADVMCKHLDEELSDIEIGCLRNALAHAIACLKLINTNLIAFPKSIMLYTYMFPISDYVSMPIIQSLLTSKCEALIRQDDVLVLPSLYSFGKPINIMITQPRRTDATVKAIQQMIFAYISAMPVTKLKLAVVDPEHHGNSIAPFFELQRVEPEIMYNRIAVTQDDIQKLLGNISDYTDELLRYRLSGEESTVFEDSENAYGILLLLFDYPAQMSDDMLFTLKNILRNGYRCGVHTLILNSKNTDANIQPERKQLLSEIRDICVNMVEENGGIFANGIECLFPPMPEGKDLSAYINRYLLTCSSVKNTGVVFHNTIKDLILAVDEEQVETAISTLQKLTEKAEKSWCSISDSTAFPEHILLGGAYYPFSVFAERIAEPALRKGYEVAERRGGNMGVNQEFIYLPYCISTRDGFNMYIEYTEDGNQVALNVAHHIMWRLLSEFPVSKLKFSVLSCEWNLNAITPFVEILKKLPDVFEDGICVNADSISNRLQRINQGIDDALQSKLGHQYDNMIDYNINTPNRAEPLTVLIVFDYPKGFDSQKNEQLSNIIRNGRKCGVFVILCHNTDIQYSRYDSLDQYVNPLKAQCVTTTVKMGMLYLQPYGLEMNMSEQPRSDIASKYIAEYEDAYKKLQRKGLSFTEVLDAELFARNSAKKLDIPIGLGNGDSVVNISFGTGSSHHALIAGATGSGKSTLLHTLIMSSMVHYSPSQLHLYLLDFKSGTEFKVYENVRLPHMKLLALDAMQEFGESILEDLVDEMTRRGEAFKSAGCTKLEDYVKQSQKQMPRILVIMDEFQILYNDMTNRRVANNCAELTKRIVTEGRAFGIHLIMATQSTKVIINLSLEAGTIEQMRVRVGMKCGESDARYLFSDRNDTRALQMMKGPIGTAVMNLEYTEEENVGLRVAYCNADTMTQYQKLIAEKFASDEYTLQIFEGGRTTDYLDYITDNNIAEYSGNVTQIDMGTMIKVAPPFVLTIDRKKRHNILICGSNERMTTNIVTNLQLAMLRNKSARIIDINGDWLVSDNYTESLSFEIAEHIQNFNCGFDRKSIVMQIRDIHAEYTRRKSEGAGTPIFIFVRNLPYIDIVQAMLKGERVMEEDYIQQDTPATANSFDFGQSYGADGGSASEKLLSVINDGASYGIFLILTSLEYQTVKECMYFGENTLAKFPERIIFSLNDSDSDNLIEGVTVSKMRENTVYFSDGVKRAFQYRPYTAPDIDRIRQYLNVLAREDVT